jgi:hypothetical protein
VAENLIFVIGLCAFERSFCWITKNQIKRQNCLNFSGVGNLIDFLLACELQQSFNESKSVLYDFKAGN